MASLITSLSNNFMADFGIQPHIATEIEFYILGCEEIDEMSNEMMEEIAASLSAVGVEYLKIEKERGKGQFEVALPHFYDVNRAVKDCLLLKSTISKAMNDICLEASFAAKPKAEDFGSGLHIHLSMHTPEGDNLFKRIANNGYTNELLWSAGGLLSTMREYMHYFAPTKESYKRFVAGANAPVSISWGTNNRTTALRLPSSGDVTRHIEHRVAGSDADVELCVAAVLSGAYLGLANKIMPAEQIFGDASLSMYNLESLPLSLEDSQRCAKTLPSSAAE